MSEQENHCPDAEGSAASTSESAGSEFLRLGQSTEGVSSLLVFLGLLVKFATYLKQRLPHVHPVTL